jgi:hypothetical protein
MWIMAIDTVRFFGIVRFDIDLVNDFDSPGLIDTVTPPAKFVGARFYQFNFFRIVSMRSSRTMANFAAQCGMFVGSQFGCLGVVTVDAIGFASVMGWECLDLGH